MIVSYFNNTKPINLLFLSVILNILILISFFLQGNEIISVINVLKINFILLSFFLFKFVTKQKILSSEKDFGLFFYVLWSGLFYYSFDDLYKIIAHFLLLISLYQLYQISNKNVNEKEKLFNNGFFLGLASLFYPLSIFYILLSFIAIIIFNKLNWRTFLIPIIGFAIPIFLVLVIKDLFGIVLFENFYPEFLISKPFLLSSIILKISVLILIFLLFWALSRITISLNSDLLFYKDYHFLILTHLLISITILLLAPNKDGSEMIFLIYPISIILANFIPLLQKKWVANFILLLLIGLLILNYNF